MAHEFESGFFVKEGAWHGLGTVIQDAPSIEEGLRLAGLDWRVSERPVYFETVESLASPDAGIQPADTEGWVTSTQDYKAIVRATDNRLLGIVGKDYTPLQNVQAFRFFDQVLADRLATLESAGSLKQGKRVWVLAKVKGLAGDVVQGDAVECYLLLCHGHDGSLAVTISFTPIRVVCHNTLTLAVNRAASERDPNIRLKHTAGLLDALEAVKAGLDIGARTFSLTLDRFRAIKDKAINTAKLETYIKQVIQVPDGTTAAGLKTVDPLNAEVGKLKELPRAYFELMEAFESQPGVQYGRGTYWQAYNAVTHYVDHIRGRSEASRLDASWFGAGKVMRDRALTIALNS